MACAVSMWACSCLKWLVSVVLIVIVVVARRGCGGCHCGSHGCCLDGQVEAGWFYGGEV